MVIKINYTSSDIYVSTNVSPVYVVVNYSGVSAGGGAVWGGITGTLSNQLDLQAALDAKFDDPTGTTAQYLRGDGSLATFPAIPGGTVTSVGLTMPSAFNVANSPVTSAGTLTVTGAGTAAQYVRGDGQLATFPSTASGGSSVNYYLNGSINASVAGYKQLSNTATIGGGFDFTLVGNGLIAQFLTDVGNPNRIEIPGGAWNFEMFFQVSSSGGNQKFYVELLKYNGTTFTLIASSSVVPEEITGGTSIDLYLTSLAVPTTALLITDRLAIRVYIVDNAVGRTITLHTEDNTLCEIITTFAGGIAALNGLSANTQYLATGTSGTDFNISSLTDTHTFNLPTASASNRGALSSADWSTFNNKVPSTRTLTINGTAYDLSADRSWTVSGTNIYSADGTLTSARTLTSGGFPLTFTGSNTAALAIARGLNLTHTLVAAANNDVLVGLDINPTFTNGAFSGVNNIGLRIKSANSKTTTTESILYSLVSNDLSNFQSLNLTYKGASLINDRAYILQTGENAVAFGGSISLQNQGGRVLIGSDVVTSISNILEVSGSSLIKKNVNSGIFLEISNTTSGTSSTAALKLTSSNGGSQIGKYSSSTSSYKTLLANNYYLYNDTSGNISILNDFSSGNINFAAGGASTAQMTLTAAGRLLLGTTTESTYLLDVNGTARVSGNTSIVGTLTTRTANAYNFTETSSNGGEAIVTAQLNAQSAFIALRARGTTYGGDLQGKTFIQAPYGTYLTTNNAGAPGFTDVSQTWHVSKSVTFNAATEYASAQVAIDSTTKGFLPPRMTTTEKNAIASPATGLQVYDTTLGSVSVYDGTSWRNDNATLTTNRQTASYTLALSDRGKLVEMNVATANNLTVPLNSVIAFPIGTKIDLSQYGAGQTTVVATGGVTVRSAGGALKLALQYSGASLVKIATDEWYLFGDITV